MSLRTASPTTSPVRRRLPLVLAGALTVGGLSLVAVTDTPAGAAVQTSSTQVAAVGSAQATTSGWASLMPTKALLTASQMPKVNSVQHWTVSTTKASFVSYQPAWRGQLHAVRRDFRLGGGKAASAVFTFPTTAKAQAAAAGLLDVTRAELRAHLAPGAVLLYGPAPVKRVAVAGGTAGYTSLVSKPSKSAIEGSFEWLGVTQRGRAVSVVVWRIGGQDATYEVDPTVAALKAANLKLATLG